MTIFNFEMLNVPFANGAISTEIAPFPDWDRGLGIAFDQTEGKPEMKGLNGLFQVLTTSMLYLKQRGISEWDSTLEYPANAFVTEGAKLYKSKRTNTNKQPSLSQLDWDVWASISDISVSTNGNLKKTVAADGSVTLEVPTASDSKRGAVRQATSTEVANRSNVNAYVTPSSLVRKATSAEVSNRSNVDAYITPINVGQTFGASLSANGWCRLPNGLILQWGVASVSGDSNRTVSLPIPFPTTCLNAQATLNSSSFPIGGDAGCGVTWSRTQLTLRNGVATGTNISYFAIGY